MSEAPEHAALVAGFVLFLPIAGLAALLIEPAAAPAQAAVLRSQRVAVLSTAGPRLPRGALNPS